MINERAKPILGNQSPLLRTIGVRVAKSKELTLSQEIVPIGGYYDENYIEKENYVEDNTQSLMLMGAGRGCINDNMPRKGPLMLGACYRCGGDHFIKDCPMEPRERNPREPPVLQGFFTK